MPAPGTSRIAVSLCMIVRDETELLPRCLAAAAGVWDELVVVDTGSTDATVEVVEAHGATVYRHTWDDDFAAARNAGLARARGDWILVLDADEFMSPGLRAQIRALVMDPCAGAATLRIRNALPHGLVREAPQLRLFRNDARVRYRMPIHEEVVTSLRPVLAQTGRTVRHLSGHVDHVGYVRAHAAGRGKKERDLRLLDRCLEADPDDLYSHYKRLELARFWDDAGLAERSAPPALAAFDRASDTQLACAPFAGDLLVSVAQALDPGTDAWSVVVGRQRRVCPSAELAGYLGLLCEQAGRLPEARASYETALGLPGVHNVQMATVRPQMGLCRIAMAEGRLSDALVLASGALTVAPQDPEVLLANVSLRALMDPASVAPFVEAHVAEHGETPQLQRVLAELPVHGVG